MTEKPLKGKLVFRVAELDGSEWEDYAKNIHNINMNKQILVCEFFYLNDVKSAVQGLLEDVKKEFCLEAPHCEGNNILCEKCKTINKILEKIKKWFPDVLEGGGENKQKTNQIGLGIWKWKATN